MALVLLDQNSLFSYKCGRCQLCCKTRRIYVNPYEIARLAQAKGISTTKFIEQSVEPSRFSLKHNATDDLGEGGCVFLESDGCGVYEDRPLACRLYPLARRKNTRGEEHFAEITPEEGTKGVYGNSETVGDFVKSQDAEEYIDFADRYFELFTRLLALNPVDSIATLKQMGNETMPLQQRLLNHPTLGKVVSELFDIDGICVSKNLGSPTERAELKATKHLIYIESLLKVST